MGIPPFTPKPEPEEEAEEWVEPDIEPKALPEPKEDDLEPLRREKKIKAAMAWLREALKEGPQPGKELTDLAQTQGHAPSTLALARKRLHLHSVRTDNRYIWYTATQWRAAKSAASKVFSS